MRFEHWGEVECPHCGLEERLVEIYGTDGPGNGIAQCFLCKAVFTSDDYFDAGTAKGRGG